MKIKTISKSHPEEMDEAVNYSLKQGWTLRGPVTVVIAVLPNGMTFPNYTQQMEKDEW